MAAIKIRLKTRITYNAVPSLQKSVVANSNAAAYNFARRTEAIAKMLAPVRTGFLKGSIQRITDSPGHHRVVVGARYGAFVEYGTRYMAAQPYFRPAVEEAKRQFKADLRNAFQVVHR
jgi:HK97 gp10 family phage protein